MRIGDRIKAERVARKLTRPELAELSGVKYPTLAGIENGDQASSTKLHAIADALGLNAHWLETGKGPKYAVMPDQSHSLSEVRSKMALAAGMVLDQFERWGIPLRPHEDADLIVGVFDILISPVENNVVHVTRWLTEQVETRGLGNVGQSKAGSDSSEDRGAGSSKARRVAKAAAGGKG